MHLFLTSSGITPNLQPAFREFLQNDPSKMKCYFIPTAHDFDEDKQWAGKTIESLAQAGLNPIWYSLKYKTKEQMTTELTDADLIWVGGGNTFYLLDVARKTGFIEIVQDLVTSKDIKYGGTSAGTILATSSIEIAGLGEDGDPNFVEIKNFDACGFTPFNIQVHYDPFLHQSLMQSATHLWPIYAVPNGSAIEIHHETIQKHGEIMIFSTRDLH